MRQPIRSLTAALAGALLCLTASAGAAAASDEAERAAGYIRDLTETAIAELGDPEASQPARAQRARQLLEANFAGRDLGRFVLGRYWRVATADQQARFLELLREVALQRFLPTFQHLDRDQVTVQRAIADPQAKGVVRVVTRIDVPQRAPVELAWRVRPVEAGGFEIVDIMAEGVSMAITLRSEYASVIDRNGGQVQPLLDQLEQRLAEGTTPAWGADG